MPDNARPAYFTVHSLSHLRAAMKAGAVSGRPIVALSAPGASAFAGAGWFAALAEEGAAEYPEVALTAILDCRDRSGDVLAALKIGLSHVIFTGSTSAAKRLAEVAAQTGASVLTTRPEAFDLLDAQDPGYRAQIWCETAQ